MVEMKKKKEIDDDLEKIKERRLNIANENQKRSRNKILQRSRQLISRLYKEEQIQDECNQENELVEEFQNLEMVQETTTQAQDEIKQAKQITKLQKQAARDQEKSIKKHARSVQGILSQPQWLIKVEQIDFEEYEIIPVPKGIRCVVISKDGKVIARDTNGMMIKKEFKSLLPGGGTNKGHCILDCVFSEDKSLFYILDLLEYNNLKIDENSSEMRFFWINSYCKGLLKQELSDKNEFYFEILNKFSCSTEGLKKSYDEFKLNTNMLLFQGKESLYTGGLNSDWLAWRQSGINETNVQRNNRNSVVARLLCDGNYSLVTLDNYVIYQLKEDQKDIINPWSVVEVLLVDIEIQSKSKEITQVELEDDEKEDSYDIKTERIDKIKVVTLNDFDLNKSATQEFMFFPDSISKIIFDLQSQSSSCFNILSYLQNTESQKE